MENEMLCSLDSCRVEIVHRRRGIVRDFLKLKPNFAGAILADPPWDWAPRADSGKGRSAEAYYDLMELGGIKSLPVQQYAKPDCMLFLWVHNTMLHDGLEVMKAWGFSYKSKGFTWVKIKENEEDLFGSYGEPVMGMGFWTRYSTETCLIGTMGHPKRLNADVREVIFAPRRAHSRKPDEIYERIERLVAGPYLELFSSEEGLHRKGWTRWSGKDRSPVRRWPSNLAKRGTR